MTRRTLTPVTVTERWPSFRKPDRLEIWQAKSRDGQWTYTRLDEPGTPWCVEHSSCDRIVMLASSLPRARRATADGSALRMLAARQESAR